MGAQHHKASIHLWAGDFASQQLAFAHILDAADTVGVKIDVDAWEVIPLDSAHRRLAPYFSGPPPTPNSPTIILYAALEGADPPFRDTALLTYCGGYSGQVLRAGSWL